MRYPYIFLEYLSVAEYVKDKFVPNLSFHIISFVISNRSTILNPTIVRNATLKLNPEKTGIVIQYKSKFQKAYIRTRTIVKSPTFKKSAYPKRHGLKSPFETRAEPRTNATLNPFQHVLKTFYFIRIGIKM